MAIRIFELRLLKHALRKFGRTIIFLNNRPIAHHFVLDARVVRARKRRPASPLILATLSYGPHNGRGGSRSARSSKGVVNRYRGERFNTYATNTLAHKSLPFGMMTVHQVDRDAVSPARLVRTLSGAPSRKTGSSS